MLNKNQLNSCKIYMFNLIALLCLSVLFLNSSQVLAGEVSVAVASNALQAMRVIKARFEKQTGDKVIISSGSTGKLYTQIINGAPFDVFLAANEREPIRLEQAHDIVPGSRMTYAVGRLVLWRAKSDFGHGASLQKMLTSQSLKRISIANPKTAPYGAAAEQFLQATKLWGPLQGKLIHAENVTQAFQYVQSQNAQMGFVALSQIKGYAGKIKTDGYWLVPQKYYKKIEQQGVLLSRAKDNMAAKHFMEYLRSSEVKKLLSEQYGYGS